MICVLGGLFDPVHYGHLRTALDVQQALGIQQVRLLPCHIPAHRSLPVLSPNERLELLRSAVADEPALEVDDRELRRDGPSYMVDTLLSVREEIGNEPLCLAVGGDALQGLESWSRWQMLGELCHLVIMQRPGNEWPASGVLADWLSESRVNDVKRLHEKKSGYVFSLGVTQLSISSTQIRELVESGASPRYLLPDVVLDKIKQENWYVHR